MPAGSEAATAMNIDTMQVAAILLLGIAIGCCGAHFYFTGFIEDRAADGQAMIINGDLYVIERYDQPHHLNLPIFNVTMIPTQER